MKKIYFVTLLVCSTLTAQNYGTFVSGVSGEYSFAKAVAMDDGQIVCTSGSPFFSNQELAIYFLNYDGLQVTQETVFPSPDSNSDAFGHAVAIEGNYVAVGAPNYPNVFGYAGAVHVYHRQNGTWHYVTRLLSTDPGFNYHYGQTLQIFENQLFVSEPYYVDSQDQGIGKIYIYNLIGDDVILAQELNDESQYRKGLAMNVDETGLMFTYFDNGTSIAHYDKTGGTWSLQSQHQVAAPSTESVTGIRQKGNEVFVAKNSETEGAMITVYNRNGETWDLQTTLPANMDGQMLTSFDVNDQANLLLAGMASPNTHSPCYVYGKTENIWEYVRTIHAQTENDEVDGFGCQVIIGPYVTLIGARSEGTEFQGKLYYTTDNLLQTEIPSRETIKITPNPVSDKLYLTTPEKIGTIQIHNMTGQLVFSADALVDAIDVSGLQQGIYLLTAKQSDNRIAHQKFIKK